MSRLVALLVLAALTGSLLGCGGSDEPKKDDEGKAVKAPGVPPTGP